MHLKFSLRQIRISVLVAAFFLLGTGFGYWSATHKVNLSLSKNPEVTINRNLPEENQSVDFALFWQVWDHITQNYIDKTAIKPKEMVYGAIKGMVSSIGDPYTMFLPPKENSLAKSQLSGEFSGVGIELGYNNSTDQILSVVAPLEGTPAKNAGVQTGDLILKINDNSTEGLTLQEAVNLIRGPKGTSVKLTLMHEKASETYDVNLVRQQIVVPSVTLSFVDDDQVAHLKLTSFGDRTNEELDTTVDKILTHEPQVKGIILDMRGNPGGYLNGAVYVASEFLSSGIVVKQEQSGGNTTEYKVNRTGKLTVQPLVVLINKGSASASEIVAGALKDRGRAKIVGEKSYGKGTVQEAEDLPGGAGLHVTVARWLTPNGTSIQKSGITPDIEITNSVDKPEEDLQLEKAIENL